MKFFTRKVLGISLAAIFGLSTLTGVGLYVAVKPPRQIAAAFNDVQRTAYDQWLKSRVDAGKNITQNPNSSLQLNATQLFKNKEASVSGQGKNIYQYGQAIFAIDKSADIKTFPNNPADINNFLKSDLLIAQALKFSGYDLNNNPNPKSQDALNFIGSFLNQAQPFIPNVFGLNPIEIVDNGSRIFDMDLGFDRNSFSQEYAAKPTVDVYVTLINSYQLWIEKIFNPLKFESNKELTEREKFANIFNFAILATPNSYSQYLPSSAQLNDKIAYNQWRQVFNDLFNNNGDFTNSKIYKYVIQPKETNKINDTDIPKFSALGNTIGVVKKTFKKYIQEISIHFLENFKFSLLTALYRQITKYLLQNMDPNDKNYQRYGSIKAQQTSGGNTYFGYKKSIYQKFKTLFASFKDYSNITFDQLEKGNPLTYAIYDNSVTNHYFTKINFKPSSDKEKQTLVLGDKNRYYPIYGSRSTSEFSFTSNPLFFGLYATDLAFAPSTINYEKGTYDQTNVDTDHYLRNTTSFNSEIVTSNANPNVSYAYNPLTDKSFWVNQSNYTGNVIGSESGKIEESVVGQTEKKSTSTDYKKKLTQKTYSLKSPGLNVFVGQFLPIMEIFVRKELEYYKQHPDKYQEKSFDPKSDPKLSQIDLRNIMNLFYKDFINQSRGDVSYYYNKSDNKRVKTSEVNKTTFENNLKNDMYKVGANVRNSIISESNAFSFYSIARELYNNISDYASITPVYNTLNTNRGITHWKDLYHFYNALIFYMINLGGTRSYNFSNSYLRPAGLNVSQVNSITSSYGLTNDGDSFDYEPQTKAYSFRFLNVSSYDQMVPIIASLLNNTNYNRNYYDFETKKLLSQEDVLSMNSIYLKLLSAFSSYGVDLYNQTNGELSDFSKKFIDLFSQDVLGMKYFLANMQFNEKVDEYAMLNGYYYNNTSLNTINNTFTNKNISFQAFKPKINWANNVLGYDNKIYSDPKINNLIAYTAVGLEFGLFNNVDFVTLQNSHDNYNYLDFKFSNSNEPNTNTVSPDGNINGYSASFSPIYYGYEAKLKRYFVNVKKNFILPN